MIIILVVIVFVIVMVLYAGGNEYTREMIGYAILVLSRGLFMILFPLIYLIIVDRPVNDCCGDSATFSPDSKLTIYVLLALSIISYFIAIYKKYILPPVIEITLNSMLIIGAVLSVVIHIQIFKEMNLFATIFCLPITIFFGTALNKRHTLLLQYIKDNEIVPETKYDNFAWMILTSPKKYIYLIIVCFPLLSLIASAMLLFGQKPDAMIRAFTDTYKHTFSQLDYECENVVCGGHYLCSVAANGHRNIVKPERYGERLGKPIICNRQLLVSNAFEELICQRAPRLHRIIRKNYNKVGDMVHKYYGIFNNKYVSDIVYIIMKPLEWIFLFTLYCFDRNPENRISKQYLDAKSRKKLKVITPKTQ